jgi:CubicO group peptidase (beta-lactamase class C family)
VAGAACAGAAFAPAFGAAKFASGSTDFSPAIAQILDHLPRVLADNDIPGFALGLIDRGTLFWAQGFGFTDRSKQQKVTPDTLFSLQSISKSYTATAMLKAVEKGLLQLDDRLTRHVPEFTVHSRFGSGEVDRITLRHLLSHRAGLCHEAPIGNNYDDRPCTFGAHIRSIADTWLICPVGAEYHYSNIGIDLAGYALQRRVGMPFARIVKEFVFDPIGMQASTFDATDALASPNMTRGHVGAFETPRIPVPMVPSGAMYSTISDMARYVAFQLAGGRVDGQQVLSEGLLAEMARPQFPVPNQIDGYGLGLYNVASFGGVKLLHGGGGYGFSTDQRWMPAYGLGVVALCNQQNGGMAQTIGNLALWHLVAARLGYVPPTAGDAAINEPRADPDAAQLQPLEGTYRRRGRLVAFTVETTDIVDNLVLVVGTDRQTLHAGSATTFSRDNTRYTFVAGADGKIRGVTVESPAYIENAVEFWALNDTPHDPPGADRPAWKAFVGKYVAQEYGQPVAAEIAIRNGYLYLDGSADIDWHGGLKLTEYQPHLFFTADGDSIAFAPGKMALGNRPFVKQAA